MIVQIFVLAHIKAYNSKSIQKLLDVHQLY